jgi:hypothetical protein
MRWIILGVCVLIGGCGVQSAREASSKHAAKSDRGPPAALAAGEGQFRQSMAVADSSVSMDKAIDKKDGTTPQQLAAIPSPADRKIIYVADLTLIVEDFSRTAKELPELVKQAGGYLSDVAIDRSSGEQRSGRWVVRVPVDRFDGFLDDLSKLGVPEGRHQTAQDVSEEYVDLDARIKNNKRLEERILKLIDERTGNIKDITDAEQQLSRVREEIERMEGRLRYLTNRTALTTVTINAREEHNYKPPELPGFTTRVATNWSGSLVSLKDSTENFLVAAVYAAPWIALWAVVLLPAILWGRRRYKRFFAGRKV